MVKAKMSRMEKAFIIHDLNQKVKALEKKLEDVFSEKSFLLTLIKVETQVFGKLTAGTLARLEKL